MRLKKHLLRVIMKSKFRHQWLADQQKRAYISNIKYNMKNILITGSNGNLGQAVAIKFLNEGYHVTGTISPGSKVATNIHFANYNQVSVDLTDATASHNFIATVIDDFGFIDIAVLTAGGFAMGNMDNTASADIMHQYKLNFETAFNVARPVFKQMMLQNNGRIFLIGSRPGLDAIHGKGMIAYALSKSLLFRLADLMNEEARGTEVFTSVVVPGTIDTPTNRIAMPNANFSSWVTPSAIAEVIFSYCTQKGSSIRDPLIKLYKED